MEYINCSLFDVSCRARAQNSLGEDQTQKAFILRALLHPAENERERERVCVVCYAVAGKLKSNS